MTLSTFAELKLTDMERVKGEKYWSIVQTKHGFEVCDFVDDFDEWDNADFETGNYFPDRESAEAMAKKFRAVLKGAEVIEMPSEEEISKQCDSSAHEMDIDDGETPSSGLYWRGWWNAVRWLKSKIVK